MNPPVLTNTVWFLDFYIPTLNDFEYKVGDILTFPITDSTGVTHVTDKKGYVEDIQTRSDGMVTHYRVKVVLIKDKNYKEVNDRPPTEVFPPIELPDESSPTPTVKKTPKLQTLFG